MNETIVIQKRYVGPPGIGNGGYLAGLLAKAFNNAAQITLRKPIAMETPLQVKRLASSGDQSGQSQWAAPQKTELYADDTLIAEAVPHSLEMDIPRPPQVDNILAAQKLIDYGRSHPYPHCFVCGPEREHGDGLRIFPVPIPGREIVAAVWEPDASLANGDGRIRSEYLWAALDCPGGVAIVADNPRPVVLGRMSGQVFPGIQIGKRYVVIGWLLQSNGRKHTTGTALFTEQGETVGYALSVWIEMNGPKA